MKKKALEACLKLAHENLSAAEQIIKDVEANPGNYYPERMNAALRLKAQIERSIATYENKLATI